MTPYYITCRFAAVADALGEVIGYPREVQRRAAFRKASKMLIVLEREIVEFAEGKQSITHS